MKSLSRQPENPPAFNFLLVTDYQRALGGL
jgi:hypothetical protein